MSIVEEARELYKRCFKNNDGRSHIWEGGSKNYLDLLNIINTCETVESVEDELTKTDMYAIRISSDKIFNLMMKWNSYNLGIAPSWVNTPNLYKMFYYCQKIFKEIGHINKIVELGGGNGQFAYMSRRVLNIKQHVDIDIPESLYMAYVCTRRRFPTAKCIWVESVEDNIDGYEFVFVPVGLEKVLWGRKYDLFVNTASMGEMPNERIRYWMSFVQDELDVRYFYGVNRFLNTIRPSEGGFSTLRANENEASVLFDRRWEVLSWEVEPLFARCPYEDPKIARYLEVCLKRGDIQTIPTGYLDDVKMEDWWRYRDCDALGSHRDGQLMHNLTKNGTLFKLWNAMRLEPTQETAEMILEYFGHIGFGVTYEEEGFYNKILV